MKTGKKTKNGIVYLLLILGAFVMVFPFIWSFLTSFKNLGETLKVPPQILPSSWNPVNYITVWNKLPFVDFIWNTLLMMLIRMVIAVFISALAAYAFARMRFPLKNFWFMICLIPMMVPSQKCVASEQYDSGACNAGTCEYFRNFSSATVFHDDSE